MRCGIGEATQDWRMSCDVGEVTEGLENELCSPGDVGEAT